MDSGHEKKRMNVEDDRLSSLPDDLIHKILSYIGLRRAIKTSSLSSRWRFVWTSMPFLDFSSEDFDTFPKFSNFVTQVLSRRNNLVEVFSIKLHFYVDVSQEFFKQVMNYAFSHNIQKLDVECLLENHTEFPLDLFDSQSLKHLSLKRVYGRNIYLWSRVLTTTSTWELPSLTTLYLDRLTLGPDDSPDKSIGRFSKCINLKNLTLRDCKSKGVNSLSVCLPRLSNLTLTNTYGSWNEFNVVTPQLKNLTIRNSLWDSLWEHYLITAPKLSSLIYDGSHPLYLSTDGFPSLEKVDLCVSSQKDIDAYGIVCLFKEFQSVKYLKLNLDIVELLSSYVELISDHPSPFTNLKTLKISPRWVDSEEEEQRKVRMSTEVKSYLLDSSPSATFTLVTREELRVMKNTKETQKLMKNFQARLEREKAMAETNKAKMHKQMKAQAENQLQNWGRVKHVDRCWKDFNKQIEHGKDKTSDIISELKEIKGSLKKLPTSKRAEMQSCFSSLCAEANTVVKNILDQMKIQCDMKESCFNMYFHELASTSESSSESSY